MVTKEISDFVLDIIVIYCLKRDWSDIPAGDLAHLSQYVDLIRGSKKYGPIINDKIREARTGHLCNESYCDDDLSRLERNLLQLNLGIDQRAA